MIRFQFYLSEWVYRELKLIAKVEKKTFSQVAREIVKRELEEKKEWASEGGD